MNFKNLQIIKKMTKKKKLKRFLLCLSFVISFVFISIFLTITIVYSKYDLDKEKLTSINNGIRVYSSSGSETTLYNTNRSIVEIETLPNYVKNAFIDIEDKRFYSHNGYDLKRIIKSAFINITSRSKSQGASTISQQLIKNALLSNEKTYSRKIKEIVLATKMEKEFNKDEILEMYLNTIYFGSNAYGIENASKVYFNKSAKDLTLNEACCLAGLIKAPSQYSPKTNYENSILRKNLVAKNMLNSGNITKQDYNEVMNSNIILAEIKENDNSYEKEAILEACRLLNITERELINKNYQILTFKDDELQENVVKNNNDILKQSKNNENSSLDSLTVVANNNGQVLAYYSNSNYNLHNLTRQPASTLKPLAVYLPCFQHNILSPASQILDEEINYNGFSPKNADNIYHGYVSCRKALTQSLNIPAVKALDYLGVKKAKETLTNLGINISNSDLNLSLALGAVKNGVNLMDLLAGYMVLANGGYYSSLCFVNKILDENGKEIYTNENYKTKVANADDCFLTTDILKDCAKKGTAKRLEDLNLPIASKTGTASNESGNTDIYNIAYTTEHTMLTWLADIDKIYLPSNLLSSSQPTEINKLICKELYANQIPNDFNVPENIVRTAYDLTELEENHILVKPNHNIERFISFDYFKLDNLPNENLTSNLDFDVEISKYGANLSFTTKKYNTYKIVKKTAQETEILAILDETNGSFELLDSNIFSHHKIEYYLTDLNGEMISEIITIRPKEYLITLLNNEILSNKKKWLV